MARIADIVTTL